MQPQTDKFMRPFILLVLLFLTGCSGGAVVFAPTPPPPDISPMRYEHPSGAFSLVVPRTWPVYAQNTTTLATATFAAPGADQPALSIAVINLGEALSLEALSDLLEHYQANIRPDASQYTEQSRQAMGDGSWRMTGLRSTTGGETEQVNTFIQQTGTLLGVLDVVIEGPQLPELQNMINAFQINPAAELQPAALSVLVAATRTGLDVVRVSGWQTPAGVFYLTGEVANYGSAPALELPIRAVLYSADGLPVAEAVDIPMGYAIMPGEFMPFSLRFGQGLPSLSRTYELIVGSAGWQPVPDAVIYGEESLSWTDEFTYNERGELVISGTVVHNGTRPVRNPRAAATIFGATGTVIGARFTDLSVIELNPGDSAPFEIIIPELGGEPAQYIVTIQAVS